MAATAYQEFVKHYFKAHPGTTMEKAAQAWNAKQGKGSAPRRRADNCASTVVPTADGSAVTTRSGGHLRASIEAHTDVQFDQGALGAIWGGLLERMRSDSGANLAALFPDLYPQAAAAMRMNRTYMDNHVVGVQMAPLLGAALVAYRVTPEEWAGWYTAAVSQRFVIPKEFGVCVSVQAAIGGPNNMAGLPAEAINQAAQMGGVLGAPGGAVLPGQGVPGNFGQLR